MSDKEAYLNYLDTFFTKWIKYYDLFSASIFNVYNACVKELDLKSSDQLLDICTGTGEISIRAANSGAKITAIDITEVMINQAKLKAEKQKLNIDFQIQDARNLPFPDNSFNKVCIGNALHDMPRKVRVQVLKEAYRVCSEKLVIVDYDLWKNKYLFTLSLNLINIFETAYFKSYAKEGLGPLLEEAGIKSKEMTTKRVWPNLFSVHTLHKSST